jgi:hydroxymethylbilane synthase
MPLRVGTRASPLARWQAEWVAAQLRQRGVEVELTPITTTGDRRQGAIAGFGGEGVFTKEIEAALLDGRIDLAVHSLKDLPTAAVPGLCLAAVPHRASAADVLVSTRAASLDELPEGATVGTGSLRRRTQLLHFRRDLQMKDIRGNVDTRLRKLAEGNYDALVLAEAGLRRLGLEQHITQVLPWEIVLPAPGQGAMALETRADDGPPRHIAAELNHPPTHAAVTAERTLLAALQGGCLAPVAALGRVDGDRLTLVGRVLSCDGTRRIEAADAATIAEAAALGRQVADALLTQGAGELIRAARESL